MATTLSAPAASAQITATFTAGAAPAPIGGAVRHTPNVALAVGTALGNVNCVISEAFTVTHGTAFTINVVTGLDPLGSAANMAHVLAVIVENDSTTTGQDFTVGVGTNPVLGTDQFTVQSNASGAGGVGMVVNTSPGYVVNGSTAMVLTITVAAGTSVAGKVTILGCTA